MASSTNPIYPSAIGNSSNLPQPNQQANPILPKAIPQANPQNIVSSTGAGTDALGQNSIFAEEQQSTTTPSSTSDVIGHISNPGGTSIPIEVIGNVVYIGGKPAYAANPTSTLIGGVATGGTQESHRQ